MHDFYYIPHDLTIMQDTDFGENTTLLVTGDLTISANVKAHLIISNQNIFISVLNDDKPIRITAHHIEARENIYIPHAVDLQNVGSIVTSGEIFIENPLHYPQKMYALGFIKSASIRYFQRPSEEHLEDDLDGEYEALGL